MSTSISAAPNNAEACCFTTASRGLQLFTSAATHTIPIVHIRSDSFETWIGSQNAEIQSWARALDFNAKDGEVCLVPGPGGLSHVLAGVEDEKNIWSYAGLPSKVPPGHIYSIEAASDKTAESAALGWALGSYSYDRYKRSPKEASLDKPILMWPTALSAEQKQSIEALAEGIYLARDMITTPAEDMAPQHIAAEALALALQHCATVSLVEGDELLTQNYPAIHTVGRASCNPPILVDMRWTPQGAQSSSLPRVRLVGKGVCFDTGGLDLKPANAMKLMKKDMGGAALILALAHVIMKLQLPVDLRVLIPAVENSVSSNSFRPLDVLQTRAGITVENGNTDAEGRLVLSDALTDALSEDPDLIVDAATLTGAARVALGTELPALFCNNDGVAGELLRAGEYTGDNLWRLPLHSAYRKMLDSKVADISSCGDAPYAGAITAALFLQEFVKGSKAWIHIDTMAYNTGSKPGRPEGGEAFGLRALWEFLKRKYAS